MTREPEAVRVMGIDPGSSATGYAVLEGRGSRVRAVAHGVIRARSGGSLAERLRVIHDGLVEVVREHAPDEVAIEEVFTAANVRSALVLGQARGAALLAVDAVPGVFEYSARAVKKAIVGYGQADKVQIVRMVTTLLGLKKEPSQDAADALAIALCHYHTRSTQRRIHTAAR
jgi:crossover junction endodeoxyribonuclease RuvC